VTWAVGTRARAMAKLREGDLADWPALLSDLTLIDQRRLGRWVAEAAETALERGNGMVRLWSTQMQEAMRPPLPPARKRAAPRRVSKPAAGSRPARARKSK
jgi:hypothetical protein